jgi:hypothetical protein
MYLFVLLHMLLHAGGHVAVKMAPIAKVGGMRCLVLGCRHLNTTPTCVSYCCTCCCMQVVHVAVEMAPIAKVGGMGDLLS